MATSSGRTAASTGRRPTRRSFASSRRDTGGRRPPAGTTAVRDDAVLGDRRPGSIAGRLAARVGRDLEAAPEGGGLGRESRAAGAPGGSRTRRDPHLQLESRLPPPPRGALAEDGGVLPRGLPVRTACTPSVLADPERTRHHGGEGSTHPGLGGASSGGVSDQGAAEGDSAGLPVFRFDLRGEPLPRSRNSQSAEFTPVDERHTCPVVSRDAVSATRTRPAQRRVTA